MAREEFSTQLSEGRAFVLGFAFGDGEGWSDDCSPSCVCVCVCLRGISHQMETTKEKRGRESCFPYKLFSFFCASGPVEQLMKFK